MIVTLEQEPLLHGVVDPLCALADMTVGLSSGLKAMLGRRGGGAIQHLVERFVAVEPANRAGEQHVDRADVHPGRWSGGE